MKRNMFRIALSCAVLLAGVSFARADSWDVPNLNPFSSKEDDELEGTEEMREEEPPPAPKKPSAWRRFSSGTKSFLTRTGEVLNPFDGKPAKKKPAKLSGTSKGAYGGVRMQKPEEEKPSFLSSMTSWMKPKEEPKKAQSVVDFLGEPRPY